METSLSLPSKQRLILVSFAYFCLHLAISTASATGVAVGVSLLRLLFQKVNLLSLQPSDNAYHFTAYLFNEPAILLTAWLCFYLSIRNRQVFEKAQVSKFKIIWIGLVGAVLGFGFLLLCSYLTHFIYGNVKNPLIEQFLSFSLIYKILFAGLGSFIAPICEELLFRRAVFGIFRQYNYIKLGVFFSSFLFALAHFAVFIKTGFLYFVGYFVAGLILAFIYHKTNSIITSIIAHILVNTASFGIYLYWFT